MPIVIAAALWCHEWNQSCVHFRCDNMAVVDLLRSRTSNEQLLMHLHCCLVFYASIFRFEFVTQHIPGILNTAADAISRNKISLFVSLIPQIPHITITQAIVDLIIMKRPDWGLQSWTGAFAHSLIRESQMPHNECTNQDGDGT